MMTLTGTKLWLAGGAAIAGIAALALAANAATPADQGFNSPSYNLAARYDSNGDSQITQVEIDTNRKEWHAKFDADKSQWLSETEFASLWATTGEPWKPEIFKVFDKNADGQVTLEEYLKPMANIVAINDKNGDGLLSRADHRKLAPGAPVKNTQ